MNRQLKAGLLRLPTRSFGTGHSARGLAAACASRSLAHRGDQQRSRDLRSLLEQPPELPRAVTANVRSPSLPARTVAVRGLPSRRDISPN
jgi:hypothetical protein